MAPQARPRDSGLRTCLASEDSGRRERMAQASRPRRLSDSVAAAGLEADAPGNKQRVLAAELAARTKWRRQAPIGGAGANRLAESQRCRMDMNGQDAILPLR